MTIQIPKYDNLQKIGSKAKLVAHFKALEKDYSNLEEWKIYKIKNTYYIETD